MPYFGKHYETHHKLIRYNTRALDRCRQTACRPALGHIIFILIFAGLSAIPKSAWRNRKKLVSGIFSNFPLRLQTTEILHSDIGALFMGRNGRGINCQMAYKPGSVSRLHDAGGDDHSSRAGCCQPPQATYPDNGTGSHQPHAACVPTWSCSGWGLPCPACCQPSGALLPHLFTLTYIRPVRRAGGLFSAALSLGSPPPGVTRHPDPVEPGLSSPTGFLH